MIRRLAVISLIICFLACACNSSDPRPSEKAAPQASGVTRKSPSRQSAVAGSFYPDRPEELKRVVNAHLAAARDSKIAGTPRGLVSPHAGYVFSGRGAASAYSLLEGKSYDAVILIGPSHHEYFGGCALMGAGEYVTPLGAVPVAEDIAGAILTEAKSRSEGILIDSLRGHFYKGDKVLTREHSLEVQVPFLQRVLPNTPIVPIVIGEQRPAVVGELGNILGNALKDRNVLLVASSDLSHFFPYDRAKELDSEFIRAFEACDIEEVNRLGFSDVSHTCGWGAVSAVMQACRIIGVPVQRITKLTGHTAPSSGRIPWCFGGGSPLP